MDAFHPHHMNVTEADLAGNGQLGRYVLLCGSVDRAKIISTHFGELKIKTHPRHHDFYMGTLMTDHGLIEVGSMSSGMGGESAEIIISELILLGAKRILRVGTAGSMQPEFIKVGDIALATAAVRDDKSSWDYIFPEYPAIASIEYVIAALRAAEKLKNIVKVHQGVVHSKSTLYGRELGYSFMPENSEYMRTLEKAGVIASEMECAQLFTLAAIHNGRQQAIALPRHLSIQVGALLAVIGDDEAFADSDVKILAATQTSISLGLETTRQISYIDKDIKPIV